MSLSQSLATLPAKIGYRPDEQAVLVGHAGDRIILTAVVAIPDATAKTLTWIQGLDPAISEVAIAVYTADEALARSIADTNPWREVVQVHEQQWRDASESTWQPVDYGSVDAAEAVLAGVQLHTERSRAELIAQWDRDLQLAFQVELIDQQPDPHTPKVLLLEDLLLDRIAGASDPAALAKLACEVGNDLALRDALMLKLGQQWATIPDLHLVAAAAPTRHLADVSTMIAGAAYLGGNEVIGDLLTKRAAEADPTHRLAQLMTAAKKVTGAATPMMRQMADSLDIDAMLLD